MIMKRKTIVMVGLAVLLVVTGYLNYQYNASQTAKVSSGANSLQDKKSAGDIQITDSPKASLKEDDKKDGEEETSPTGNFFMDFRIERDKVRDQEVEYLNSIIENKATDKDTLKEAMDQMIEITKAMEKEVTIEGLIKAKGFDDVVVTLHQGSVNVILKESQLSEAQVAKILDIVRRESGEKAENIKIIPAK